ncbi:MAG: STAS domain-containing protein, partial [Planctomycetota bacterium]
MEREEVVILRPETVGEGKGGEDTGRLTLGDVATAIGFGVELPEDDDVEPLARAAETLVRQGKRHIVIDLSRFDTLAPGAVEALLETHRACEAAGGRLVLAGVRDTVLEALGEAAAGLHVAADTDAALAQMRDALDAELDLQRRAAEHELDLHTVVLGPRRPSLPFTEGYRRLGPDGLPREVVRLRPTPEGLDRLATTIESLLGKKLRAFVLDLEGVSLDTDTAAALEQLRARLEDASGYLALAGLDEASRRALGEAGAATPVFEDAAQAISGVAAWIEARGSEASSGGGQGADEASFRVAEADDSGYLVHRGAKKPGRRKMAPTATLHVLTVQPEGFEALAEAITEHADRAPRLVLDLSDIGELDDTQQATLERAARTARDAGVQLWVTGIEAAALPEG